MSYFNIVASSTENTVVTEYTPIKNRSANYQSEAELEKEFIDMLTQQGYEYLSNIHQEKDLIINLRKQIQRLNDYVFSDSEWNRFFNDFIANQNESIAQKTKKIQEDFTESFRRDDGTTKNIKIIDKDNIHNNSLQVINQYEVSKDQGANHNNRYDVTILVNGLPLVHIELKRRGVAIKEAFNQINRYQRESFWAGSSLFQYVQIFVISNGTHTKYYSNTTRCNARKEANVNGNKNKTSNSFEFTSFWADANNNIISDLIDFTQTFFAKHTILNIITKYCVFTSENMLLVMRPYQITATERILNRIEIAHNYKRYGHIAAGGYIWHTTGSGKTLTSFKTAMRASKLDYIDKVLFVVDRKDLDYQTMKEYDRFQKGAANSSSSTTVLKKQLEDNNSRIIITTIQKLAKFISANKIHEVYDKQVVIIFDECHRSQFGDMHKAIIRNFKKYYIFGFTGTPIFSANTEIDTSTYSHHFKTTEQVFGDQLHSYTIVDAINDKNVLPFKIDYINTMNSKEEIEDEDVFDINRERAFMAPQRIELITKYILDNFDKKTYRNDKTYSLNTLTNISEVASSKKNKVEEIRNKKILNGFNSIFAVASVQMAKLYYQEFKKQMELNPAKKLRVATIYSYSANESEEDLDMTGIFDEENPEDTSKLDQSSREFLEIAINDYNQMFNTSYSTDGDKFQNYYRDVSMRMKNKELDILIVVNMFLTGFDATTLNTLWVDKKLKMHGLIQAFSRTNRILNSIKSFGNIVCFRPLQKNVDIAISLFGDKNAGGIVLMKKFEDYYFGYTDLNGEYHPGYADLINDLTTQFPINIQIVGETNQKEFIGLFGAILRMRNILFAFDDFDNKQILSERDFQDYLAKYQDLRDEWNQKRKRGESTDIIDDIVFEIELIEQIEIGIDYILILAKKYHDTHCNDKDLYISIQKAIDSSPELRSKKALIENFIAGINYVEDVLQYFRDYTFQSREEDLAQIIREENLDELKTRQFIEKALRDGEVKTIGTDIVALMPPMARFGDNNRQLKKQNIIDKLQEFVNKYYNLGIEKFVA
ncbi:MAG: type I restriction endonuclease subunit R [Malacoplasma sp.]|nr:type I restriction endonuclease subunit R [Malacoplasma sp.]